MSDHCPTFMGHHCVHNKCRVCPVPYPKVPVKESETVPKGTIACPICGYDQPHSDADHLADIPLRPEIDGARMAFEQAWLLGRIRNKPEVWHGNELERNGPTGQYRMRSVQDAWWDFRTAWLLARGRRDEVLYP